MHYIILNFRIYKKYNLNWLKVEMESMQGFKALNVKYSERSKATHFFFVKPHNVREKVPEKPPERTLFVVGVPPYCNEDTLKRLFGKFGNVTAVYLHKTPSAQIPPIEESKYFPKAEPVKGFKIAYVVFQKESSIKKILQCEETLYLPNELILTGTDKWSKEYNERFPDQKEMEKEIKSFMDKYDEEANKKIQEEKDLSQEQDGWVTVTKRGRNPGFARKESVVKQLRRRGERQRKKKELTNFYTFQIKESKMKNLVSLRKKFEDDKRKIAALREARKFKPF